MPQSPQLPPLWASKLPKHPRQRQHRRTFHLKMCRALHTEKLVIDPKQPRAGSGRSAILTPVLAMLWPPAPSYEAASRRRHTRGCRHRVSVPTGAGAVAHAPRQPRHTRVGHRSHKTPVPSPSSPWACCSRTRTKSIQIEYSNYTFCGSRRAILDRCQR